VTQYKKGFAVNILLENCDYARLDSKNWCKKIVTDIAKKIKMKMLMSPVAIELDETQTDSIYNTGVSAFVIIAESHIALHTWPHSLAIRIAIDSCKEFDITKLECYLKNYFGTNEITYYGSHGVCSNKEVL